MLKEKLIGIGFIIAFMLIPSAVLAAVGYTADFTLSSNATYNNYPFVLSVNNTMLADAGFMQADGLDAQVELGGSRLETLVADNKTLFIIPSLGTGTATFQYTTGNTPVSYMPLITGRDGYFTITDAANLEGGDNFSNEASGYFFTDNGTEIIFMKKGGATKTRVSAGVSGNITSFLAGDNTSANYTLTSSMLSQDTLPFWNAANLVDGNTGTSAFDTNGCGTADWMQIDFGAENEVALLGWYYYTVGAGTTTWSIQYSEDTTTWIDAYTGLTTGNSIWVDAHWTNVGAYRYWRSIITGGAAAQDQHRELVVSYTGNTVVTVTGIPEGYSRIVLSLSQ